MRRFVLTLAVTLGTILICSAPLSLATPLHAVLANTSGIQISELLVDTNAQRQAAGLPLLTLNSQLTQAASAKGSNMVTEDYWSHYGPDGQTPWSFINAAGYDFQAAGENLAYGFSSAAAVLDGWMNSPEHRANILNSRYSDVGLAVVGSTDYVNSGPQFVVIAEYGQPAYIQPTATAVPISPSALPSSAPLPQTVIPASSSLGTAAPTPPLKTVTHATVTHHSSHQQPSSLLSRMALRVPWLTFSANRPWLTHAY